MLNVPNTLTIIRLIFIPAFITAAAYKRFDYALYIFVAAALTDKLDGFIARMTNTSTTLGAFLDPLADKFMLVTSFIVFFIEKLIPLWLAIVVISRDIIVTIGWLVLYLTGHTQRVAPSFLGKLAIASQFFLFTAILLELNYGVLGWAKGALVWAAAALAGISGVQYILRGLRLAGERKAGN